MKANGLSSLVLASLCIYLSAWAQEAGVPITEEIPGNVYTPDQLEVLYETYANSLKENDGLEHIESLSVKDSLEPVKSVQHLLLGVVLNSCFLTFLKATSILACYPRHTVCILCWLILTLFSSPS